MNAQLPVPEIREDLIVQHTQKQVNKRDDSNRLRPPKLKPRNHHDSNINRSHSMSSAQLITFPSEHSIQYEFPHSTIYNKSNNETYFEQCFSRISKIGEGSFGEVFKVRSMEDGMLYAVKMSKQLFRGENYRQQRLEEVKRYEQFSDHENCVRFYKAWEQDDRLYMQMELCRESLEQYIERKRQVPEDKIWSMLLDLLLALKSLHDKNLIHLDIKLDNILIDDDSSCKLADFGLVTDLDKANQVTEGDSRYIAPEVMQGNFSKAADVFSLGIAMLELSCCLELPSNGPLWQQLRSGVLPEMFIEKKSAELQTIIKQMMLPEPNLRPTVDQLLKHKKMISQLQRRKRFRMLRKFKQAIRHSRRVAWAKVCNLKRRFSKYFVFLFGSLKVPKRLRSKVKNTDNLKNNQTSRTQPNILLSTPTSSLSDNRARSHVKNELFTLSNNNFDDSPNTTPTSFTNLKIVNSTPLNHSMRSRKDLTKTSFRTADNGFEQIPMDKSNSFLCLEDIDTQSCSFVKNSFDTSSLRGKKLFANMDESE